MFSLKKQEIHDTYWSRVWKPLSACGSGHIHTLNHFKAQKATWCYTGVSSQHRSEDMTLLLIPSSLLVNTSGRWPITEVWVWCILPHGCHVLCPWDGRRHTVSSVLVIILLCPSGIADGIFTLHWNLHAHSKGSGAPVDGWMELEDPVPKGTVQGTLDQSSPGITRVWEITFSHSLTLGLLAIKASIKAPVCREGRSECERGRKAQTLLYVMATFHKVFCYHGNAHGINT